MDYGLKVSQPGFDATAASPTQTLYSSKWNNFKILQTLTGTITVHSADPDGVYHVTVTNPQSTYLMFMAFIESTTTAPGKWQLASIGDASGTVDLTTDTHASMPNCIRGGSDFDCSVSLNTIVSTRVYTFKIILFIDDLLGNTHLSTAAASSYGLKISETGANVEAAADTDTSFKSKFFNLTVAATGNITAVAGGAGISVTHNLGKVPMYIVFVEDPTIAGNWYQLPTLVQSNPAGFGVAHAHAYVDSTTLYFDPNVGFNSGAPTNIHYKYVIFNEAVV